MNKIYLFDWGDTLMVDFPGVPGKMCDWEIVETIDGAKETLEYLSQHSPIFIATGASESTESEIKRAFKRVGLSRFITGYYCKANIGLTKGSPGFLEAILADLGTPNDSVVMVGDSLAKDIEPAAAIGVKSFWLSNSASHKLPKGSTRIGNLRELCI